ncbi:MAG: ethanolamine ammonia-lyase subunit EutC [Deltaproteobacteria bacterium]|nr:ethanolamine ammonia-lyase subunit EutC [Deltaproteobacteria bacterium]
MSSRTRQLIEVLRIKLGEARPLAQPAPARPVQAKARASSGPKGVPRVVTSHQRREAVERFAQEASKHTTALVGIGSVGTRYATDTVLQFQAELAVAHEAVGAVLPKGWAESKGLLPLKSRVSDHRQFLLRPDLGRRLDESSVALINEEVAKDVDVQPILADGLSAVACMGAGMELLEAFTRECQGRGLSVGTPLCAQFARVWLEDEIGELTRAKVAVILLGERPGLGTGDGLSAYLVYEPKVGKTDGDRNMMSNIHARGTPPEQAGKRLAVLVGAMLEQRRSGVDLDLSALSAELGEAAGLGYRAPQEREQLVEVSR